MLQIHFRNLYLNRFTYINAYVSIWKIKTKHVLFLYQWDITNKFCLPLIFVGGCAPNYEWFDQ